MTWEETIEKIRKDPEFKDLVRLAYFDADLGLNVKRFGESEEFEETLSIIKAYRPDCKSIIDIGSGNGISAINFALQGLSVTSVEPDRSNTVGSGAIRILKEECQLNNIEIFDSFAEDISFSENSFDVVYVRQAMHHANNLEDFIRECVRVLKPNGLLLTVRDHVIYDKKDKDWFLASHPLHKFYGGENAYTAEAYKNAITKAGAMVEKELKHFDSVINYFPLTMTNLEQIKSSYLDGVRNHFNKRVGVLSKFPGMFDIYKLFKGIDSSKALKEKDVAGRMYTYIAIKK